MYISKDLLIFYFFFSYPGYIISFLVYSWTRIFTLETPSNIFTKTKLIIVSSTDDIPAFPKNDFAVFHNDFWGYLLQLFPSAITLKFSIFFPVKLRGFLTTYILTFLFLLLMIQS